MTDNGGESNSDKMKEITSILKVQLCTTSGENSFQNGLCERVNGITDMRHSMVRYILRQCSLEQTWPEILYKCGTVIAVTNSFLEKNPNLPK